ncbi:glutamate--tRNA ligase [soil metagenome]
MRAMSDSPVRTRFAPSPTGSMHLGNARTALFNWLFARRHGGRFILRSEDTDRTRSRAAYLDTLLEDLEWLGLVVDEGPAIGGPLGPYRQTERGAIYAQYFDELEQQGAAYLCFCSPEELARSRRAQAAAGRPPRYDGTCRDLSSAQRRARRAEGRVPALRFRVPAHREVVFDDLVRGPQRFSSADLGDFVIRRADRTPAFLFGNAVDDALMRITHVLRGEDHLANTPRQILLLEALTLGQPRYAHLALLTDADGTPLSKRRGSESLAGLARAGFMPLAVANCVARLGHAYAHDGWLDLDGLAAAFSTARLGRAPARFDRRQLEHWQRETIARSDAVGLRRWIGDDRLALVPVALRDRFVELIAPNILYPEDAAEWVAILFGEPPELDPEAREVVEAAGSGFFRSAVEALAEHGPDALLRELSAATGVRGRRLFMPLRLALTARREGPELDRLIGFLPPESLRLRLSRWAA